MTNLEKVVESRLVLVEIKRICAELFKNQWIIRFNFVGITQKLCCLTMIPRRSVL